MQINLTLPEGYFLNSLLQFNDGSWRIDLRRDDEEWTKFTIYNGIGASPEAALEEAVRRIEGELEINPYRLAIAPELKAGDLLALIGAARPQGQPTRTRS